MYSMFVDLCSFQLVHFVNRDSLGLANDFLSLGFIPEEVDIQPVADALKASFNDGSRQSQDFQVCASAVYIDVDHTFGYLISSVIVYMCTWAHSAY